jgi:3-oxoacyl-[acyl-carrier protein] reductase
MFRLDGQTALVTGASGGIGGAVARALHQQGAAVVLAGRRVEPLEQLRGELGERASIVLGDLTEADAAERLTGAAEAAGNFSILINNAGITRDTLLLRMKDADWDTVIDTNLSACFRLARAAVKGMLRRRYGRIINIGSIVGATGNPGQVNYAAAKAGLVGMTKAMAAEVAARNITVNCIAPGFIKTAMTDALEAAQRDALLGRIPAGRLGTGEDVATAAVFLAGPAASYITGQTLHVNGGMAMI